MLIVELPVLPIVSALDGTTFEAVLQTRFISLSGPKRRFNQSQRQVSSMFNRSSRKAIGNHLFKAQEKGFIKKIHLSTGADPDEYIRGHFFDVDSEESRALIKLTHSLWGTGGLLRTWPFPTAWGHGCIPSATILVLATLSVLDESISKKSLRRYLLPLVKDSSFNSAMKFITERHLAYSDNNRFIISSDWKIKVKEILEKNPACNERQIKGDHRRRTETELNRMRLAKSELTDAERIQLLKFPCVVEGCTRRSQEVEHFPPKRFLGELKVITNRQFVWAICWKHNHQMQSFIKKMPHVESIPPVVLRLTSDADPLRIYNAVANQWIRKFYDAYKNNDVATATFAVVTVIGLWKAISQVSAPQVNASVDSYSRKRKHCGKNMYAPGRSQLPFRA